MLLQPAGFGGRRAASRTVGPVTELRNDFPAGVLTGEAVNQVFALAKANQFALPAANCIGTDSMNAVMETAGKLNSPVILQFSSSGGAFVGGKNVPVDGDRASVLGSLAGARHVHTMAEAYGARVILHTDHCPKKKLGWVSGLLDEAEQQFESTGTPIFSSHMLDLSEEPMEENIDICVEYLKRMAPMGMTLEIELGITGGEEDGVDNSGADPRRPVLEAGGGRLCLRTAAAGEPELHDRGRVRQRARRVQAGKRETDPDDPA